MTDKHLVDAYRRGSPHDRFCLIYRNYSVFQQMVDSFEMGVIHTILCEKEYNSRNRDILGNRILEGSMNDVTAAVAVDRVTVMKGVRSCELSEDLLRATDDPEKHRIDILTIRAMRREQELFEAHLRALPEREYRITYRYIHKDLSLERIACDEDRADHTIRNILSMTRRKLEENVTPFFRENIQEDMF